MTQCVSSQHPNWLSLCTSRDGSIPVPLSGAFPAPATAEQTQFHICSHPARAAPCVWGCRYLCQRHHQAHLKVTVSGPYAVGEHKQNATVWQASKGTDLAENYPCLLAQLSAAPGPCPGSPVTCTNIGQKEEIHGNEWPQKYMWRVH